MTVRLNPYPRLILENYMSIADFEKLQYSIDFNEIKNYCDNPESPEHDNAQHGNYSMPCEFTDKSGWVFDYFAKSNNFKQITQSLYGKSMQPDHWYVNFHYDKKGTSLGVHNDQKKYRWLVTGQLYVQGNNSDGVILQDHNLKEVDQVPLKPNLFYAIATSMYSWHHVKEIKQDKISVLFRFGKKQINTVTNPNSKEDYGIIIHNTGHYDGHYSKLGMRMANITEAWLSNQGYFNIHMSEWRNDKTLDLLKQYCSHKYKRTILVPSGYLGNRNLLKESIQDSDIEKITKENIQHMANTIFNRSEYNNTRFRAGEIILSSFNNLKNFSDCDIL